MVLVHQNPVVVLTTGVTASTRMLAMLANAAMAGADVTAFLPVLPEPCEQQPAQIHPLAENHLPRTKSMVMGDQRSHE